MVNLTSVLATTAYNPANKNAVTDPEILKGRGMRKTMCQPCHHLSQMHTVK